MNRWIAISLSGVLAASCMSARESTTEQTPQVEARAPEPASTKLPFHLVDQLEEATIESPLNTVTAVDKLPAEAKVAHKVLSLDFEKENIGAFNWRSGGCTIAARPGGEGRAIRYRGRNPHTCLFVASAKPQTHYIIRRSARTPMSGIDYQLIETRTKLRNAEEINAREDVDRITKGRFVAMKDLLFIHRFSEPRPGEWSTDALHVFTSPSTHSFTLMLNDAEATVTNRQTEAFFDDISVEAVDPTPEQELGLLKAANELGEDARGMAKHGQFLPVGDAQAPKAPYDENFDYREVLFAPAPTAIALPVSGLPKKARLSFSYAAHEASRSGDEITFTVSASIDGKLDELFSETVVVGDGPEGWSWKDARISLEKLAGKQATLHFHTEAGASKRGYGMWGHPLIDQPRAQDEPPNVILVAVDTLRADRMSAYGYERTTSPHIDRLAKDGVVFERAISGSNWTSPAFASIFTGEPPSTHQVVHRARAIPSSTVTLTEHFRAAGYVTEAIAYKPYLYNMGFEQGFERWYNVPSHEVEASANLERAMSWLERNHDRRFFLFLHFNDPHQPFNQPKPFDRRYNDGKELARLGVKLPIIITGKNEVLGCRKCGKGKGLKPEFKNLARDLYDGEVAYIDDRLGVFLDALRERGVYDNTIIAFVADHGELMWEHADLFAHGGTHLYDELTRVPLIIKPQRGMGKSGARISTPVQAYDVMPTLIELAGLEVAGPRYAQSLARSLTEGDGAIPKEAVFTENVKQHVTAAELDGFKWVLSHPPAGTTTERLFNLKTDPGERSDLSRRAPADLERLRETVVSFVAQKREGRYLTLTGDFGNREVLVKIVASKPLRQGRALFGLSGSSVASETLVVRGRPSGRLATLIELRAPADTSYTVTVEAKGEEPINVAAEFAEEEIVNYDEGSFQALLKSDKPTVTMYRGAPPAVNGTVGEMNAQRLQALRTLGYIE